MKALKKIYRYYKSQRDGTPLFRVNNDYVTAFQDAERLGEILNSSPITYDETPILKIPSKDIFDTLALLHKNNVTAYLVSCRNDKGCHDIPNIDELKKEQLSDY